MLATFENIYADVAVLITGHTGFKGAWLALWLQALGAQVIGYSLPPPTEPNLFSLTHLATKMTNIEGDIRDLPKLQEVLRTYKPQIAFHLAAQSLVIPAYEDPLATFEVNAMGTVNVLEAARTCPGLKAVICVTTDKCYENRESPWGYREGDPLGGKDPYSASKAMAELAIQAYRSSFPSSVAIASVRAGNVIGGGDFSPFRILPDTLNALLLQQSVEIRNPSSVRPWLSVLDALSGYLWLGSKLLQGAPKAAAWNFGPLERRGINVSELVEKTIELWGSGSWQVAPCKTSPEMHTLRLDWDQAARMLDWQPTLTWDEALLQAVDWTKEFAAGADMSAISQQHLQEYTRTAVARKNMWAIPKECHAFY